MRRSFIAVCCLITLVSCSSKYELPSGEPSDRMKAGLESFVRDAEEFPLKSIIVLQHGKKVGEAYMNGAEAGTAQAMWSVSKTFTSFAVGYAVEEGLLSLDDKLTDLFPEETSAVLDTITNAEYADNLRSCTLRDLMVMGCGHDTDPSVSVFSALATDMSDMSHIDSLAEAAGINAVQEFFKFPFKHAPSTYNCYNSLGSYILSVAVTRATGERVNDYLYPRLWKKLGVEKPQWDMMQGYDCGGWGLQLTTEVMARVGQMMLDGGRYAGRQVLPEAFLDEASSPFFEWDIPSGVVPWSVRHLAIGYGYQIWKNTDAFFASGHMGQFIYVFPEYDAVVAVTAAFESGDGYTDSGLYVWKNIVPALQEDCYEKVEIQGTKGVLKGYIDRPSEKDGQPVVIVCHGLTGSKDELHLVKVSDELRQRGIASVRFDFNGHGQSDGLFREHTVANEVEEVKLIYDYVKSLPWVDTTRIGLTGHSQGGFVSGVAAGDLGAGKIRALALMAPAALIHTTTEEGICFGDGSPLGNLDELPDSMLVWGRYFGREYFKAALETDVYARTAAYEGPVYILQGTADSPRLYQDALKYKDYLKDCTIEFLDGYPHCYDPNIRKAASKVADWFEENL